MNRDKHNMLALLYFGHNCYASINYKKKIMCHQYPHSTVTVMAPLHYNSNNNQPTLRIYHTENLAEVGFTVWARNVKRRFLSLNYCLFQTSKGL